MKAKKTRYRDESPAGLLVLRETLGLKRYRKMARRDAEKRSILMGLALKKMEEKEKEDFVPVGYRRRRVNIS
ncbi:MAG: hypothetical protein C4581_10595 [Nitrospiraceae bacterium]|nr:MAG: hypothetical protein C4581_10595 [Nitrospiraceae bacterium]